MRTLIFGGTIKSVIQEFEKKFNVVCKINTINGLEKDYDLEELIKNNFSFTPLFDQDAQNLFINFHKSNFNIFCRMFIRRGAKISDYHELNNHFAIFFYCFFEILKKKKIQLIIFNNFPHQGLDFILYKIAKILEIKTILLTQSIFPNKYIMISNLLDFGKFKNENKNFDKKVVDEILSFKDYYSDYQSKWEKKIKKFNLSPSSPTHLEDAQNIKKPNLIKKTKDIFKRLFIFLNLINRENLQKKFEENISSIELNNEKVKRVLEEKNKKIFVALHSQPEMSTSLLAGDYDDQIRIIEKLKRKKISDNFDILIREHPIQTFYQRDEFFFKRLKYLNTIKILNRNYPIDKIIASSKAIVTCSGTIGWEGLLLGKKCLLFGESWYSNLYGVLKINDKTRDDEILNFLQEEFDYSKFYSSVQNLYNSFKNGVISKWYIPISENFDDKKNAQIICDEVFKYVNTN